MDAKRARWWAGLVLLAGLAAPTPALAGPFLGDWGWCWNPAPDCPPGEYSWHHYWFVGRYKARMWLHPSYLDQYPPGPCPITPAPTEFEPSQCRTQPPHPSAPYAEPAAYFGRSTGQSIAPP